MVKQKLKAMYGTEQVLILGFQYLKSFNQLGSNVYWRFYQ